jgi:hypothetical protein
LGAGLVQFRLHNPSSAPVEMALVPDVAADEWFFAPEHVHTRLEPGEAKTFTVTMARVRNGFRDGFVLPTVSVETDYLTAGARVTLPPRKVNFPVGIKTPEPAFFQAPEKNLVASFDGKSALRVELNPKDLPDGPFTVEAWVKPATEKGTAPFVAKTEQSEYALNLANNVPGFHCFIGGKYVSAIAPTEQIIPAQQWTHVAGVFDGQEMRLYVNGNLAAKTPATGARKTNVLPLYIGADPDAKSLPTQFYSGELDELRLSKSARYQENFKPALRHARDAETLLLFHCEGQIGPFIPSDAEGNRYATSAGAPKFIPANLSQN